MTGLSSHGGVAVLDAVFAGWVFCKIKCMCLGICHVFCRNCGSCFTCVETVTAGFVGCNFNFYDFRAFAWYFTFA